MRIVDVCPEVTVSTILADDPTTAEALIRTVVM